ncbi:hypothetical protein NDU88_005813 [Pleurodeles waltl]|uniref:Uncharacterized protein n=1 Tax=Pleurodeles waltl TaxID=8319 RepID=A0AAV7SMQ1_PLEWA|nr:hypothetical protein NDU88_005813 [Pleurodeles waltl]
MCHVRHALHRPKKSAKFDRPSDLIPPDRVARRVLGAAGVEKETERQRVASEVVGEASRTGGTLLPGPA